MQRNVIDVLQLVDIARKAGVEIMKIYATDFSVERKSDNSPLTEADRKSNAVILEALKKDYSGIPYISEETKQTPYSERKNWTKFWLIDPIDGTKEFIKKNGEFTVNIALIEDGVPVIGVVHAPALDKTYYGLEGQGSFAWNATSKSFEQIRNTGHYQQKSKVVVVASRSHLTDETLVFVEKLKSQGKEVEFISSGSSLKFCLVAEGKADVYPRFGPTMEWDTGAAHAVALYAGKNVINVETGLPLIYNKENLLNPYFIVE
jgi:3'(2'), 5'-bisphosphate nucleotidase